MIDKQLIQIAKKYQGKVYLVGGMVRDQLLGIESKDEDYLFTKIPLSQLKIELEKEFPNAKVNEVGESFGVIKMTYKDQEYDFAIPRSDIDRDQVKVDHTLPVEADLSRRDFTINALAKDIENGYIIGEVSDIINRTIKAVGNPFDRFREDPLRMLRALQFSARLGFEIEENTFNAIVEHRRLLKNVSVERFYDEFIKAMTKGKRNIKKFYLLLYDTYIGEMMFGEDFDPIMLSNKGISLDTLKISMFLYGGDYTKLFLSINDRKLIEGSRAIYKYVLKGKLIPDIFKYTDIFNIIRNALKTFFIQPDFYKIFQKPLAPKFLPMGGGEIIDYVKTLGVELKGKEISNLMFELVEQYQKGVILYDMIPDMQYINVEYLKHYLELKYEGMLNEKNN
jgi:hypothetical protein